MLLCGQRTEEQERGVTIKSTGVTLCIEQDYALDICMHVYIIYYSISPCAIRCDVIG